DKLRTAFSYNAACSFSDIGRFATAWDGAATLRRVDGSSSCQVSAWLLRLGHDRRQRDMGITDLDRLVLSNLRRNIANKKYVAVPSSVLGFPCLQFRPANPQLPSLAQRKWTRPLRF